jgi:hypothetical protein
MTIAILGAMPGEVATLSAAIEGPEVRSLSFPELEQSSAGARCFGGPGMIE